MSALPDPAAAAQPTAASVASVASVEYGQSQDGEARKSAATTLVDLAQQRYRFGCAPDGEAFAVPASGPRVVATLRGNRQSLRGQLAREYFRATGRAAPQQALADALLVIEGIAQDAEPEPLHLRVAEHGGAHWLDLGDASGRAVRVDANGWDVTDPPVLFRRTVLTGALPVPERGGSLSDLWRALNISEADKPLAAAYLVAALHTDIAHPVLTLLGEQGTGKSTAARMLVSCIDASPAPLRKPPRDADSWVTAAAGSWVVGLDNLSAVPDWLSDSICRAVTGDGDVRRRLYTDGDHAVFSFRRCIIANGIDLGAVRGDLAERMLPINLDLIPDDSRLCDTEIWPRWTDMQPRVLGAVLDLAASVARMIPSLRLDSKPRMADFAKIVAAVDSVLGTSGLAAYLGKQGALAIDALSGDALFAAIAERYPRGFEGTAADLYAAVTPERPPRGWPADARAVTQRLKRLAPVMRKAGWRVSDDGGANHRNAIRWDLRPPTRPEIACNPGSRCSQDSRCASDASVASTEYGPSQDDCRSCAGEGCAWCRA